MTQTIIIMTAVLLATLLIYAATKPNIFRIGRSTSIKASPDRIFALITDFHNWGAWSPYEKMDPAMKRNLSGKPRGKGAVYEWESNSSKAGIGRLEIIETATPSKAVIQLDLAEPFEIRSIVEFTLESKDDATQVTCDMRGINPYTRKVMGIFYDRDSVVAKEFEEGLANLKTIAER